MLEVAAFTISAFCAIVFVLGCVLGGFLFVVVASLLTNLINALGALCFAVSRNRFELSASSPQEKDAPSLRDHPIGCHSLVLETSGTTR